MKSSLYYTKANIYQVTRAAYSYDDYTAICAAVGQIPRCCYFTAAIKCEAVDPNSA